MGRMSLLSVLDTMREEQALEWHLTGNHYPPVHRMFIPSAKECLEFARNNDLDHEIKLPNGKVTTVQEMLDDLHLWDFLETEEDY